MLLILILLIVRGTRCCSILLQLLPPVRCYYRCTCMQCLRSIRSNRAPGRFNCCCCSACICSSRMASKRCATSNNSNNSINSKECSSNEAIDLLTTKYVGIWEGGWIYHKRWWLHHSNGHSACTAWFYIFKSESQVTRQGVVCAAPVRGDPTLA